MVADEDCTGPILRTVRVLAEGRASEILELGEDRVLRRFEAAAGELRIADPNVIDASGNVCAG